jgi:hypothetical protein
MPKSTPVLLLLSAAPAFSSTITAGSIGVELELRLDTADMALRNLGGGFFSQLHGIPTTDPAPTPASSLSSFAFYTAESGSTRPLFQMSGGFPLVLPSEFHPEPSGLPTLWLTFLEDAEIGGPPVPFVVTPGVFTGIEILTGAPMELHIRGGSGQYRFGEPFAIGFFSGLEFHLDIGEPAPFTRTWVDRTGTYSASWTNAPIPEPGTWAMMALGLAGLLLWRRARAGNALGGVK